MFKRLTATQIVLALFASLLTAIAVAPPARAAASTTCGVSTDTVGFSGGGFEITPLHGNAFYLDLKKSINASYIGYKVKNISASASVDFWLELTNFRSPGTQVLGLANPADAYQPIGRLTVGASKVIYILLKSNSYSADNQTHDVRVHSGYPNGTSSIVGATAGAGGAQCFYTFSRGIKSQSVVRTLAASANKVNSITVNTTSPVLGSTVVVTVQGQTGQTGSGSVTPDGEIMWLSAASSSSWPTRSLRLESTSIDIKITKTSTPYTINDTLLLSTAEPSKKFRSSTTYTARFTFRILGGLSSNPAIKPVAQIASGTQIKHTGSYPSAQTTINLTGLTSSMTSSKNVVSIGALETVTGVVYRAVNYKITETDTALQTTIDKIVDDPAAGVIFKAGSAKIHDSLRITAGGTAIADPVEETTTATDRKYTFGGPFKGYGSVAPFVVELTYTMLVPTNAVASYTNVGYALVGNTIVGRSSSTVGAAGVVVNGTTDATVDPLETSTAMPKQPQVIDFPALPSLGVGSTFTLDAVSESGLPVTYTSTTPDVCTVTDGVLSILTTGTCSITASQAGNGFWDPATNVPRSTTTLPGQVITFVPDQTMAVGGSQVKAATSDSGLPVTLTVLTPEICEVSAGPTPFTISGLASKSGACVIVASQAGGTSGGVTYGAAMEVERTINIGALQAILFGSLTNKSVDFIGYTISATSKTPTTAGSNTSLAVTFTSNSLDVCEITTDTSVSSGVSSVTVVGIAGASGICSITTSQDGLLANGDQSAYAPAVDVTQTFIVGTVETVPTIVVATNVNTIASGGEVSATATITVQSSGSLTGTVTLYVDGTRASSSAISTTSVNVSLSPSGTSVSTFTSIRASVLAPSDPDGEMVFTATFTRSGGSFSSTATRDPALVAVTAQEAPVATTDDVLETAVGIDTATITGSYIPKGSDTATAVIYLGTASGSLTDSTTAVVNTGGSASGSGSTTLTTLASTLTTATKYFYKTSVVRKSYEAEGVVKSFTTKPIAPTVGAATRGSTSASIAFTTITPGAGVTIAYRVICTSSDGGATGTATGSSSPIVVSGLTSGGKTYTCKVAATTTTNGSGGGGYGAESSATSSFVTLSAKTSRTIEIKASTNGGVDSSTTVSIVYGDTATLVVLDTFNDGLKSATKASGSACSLLGLQVSSVGIGSCTFDGAVSEGTTYSEAATTVVANVVVGRKVLTVTASTHSSVAYGSNAPIVTSSITGFVNGENRNSASGFVVPTCVTGGYTNTSNAGSTFVTSCSGAAADNYSFTYLTGLITVVKRDQVISFTNPLDMDETETAQSLNVTVDSVLTPTVTTTTSNKCSVSAGAVTPSSSGTCTLVASQSGDTNHNPAPNVTKNFTIRGNGGGNNNNNNSQNPAPTPVVRQKPTINWSNPAAINVGTPLSGTQLNAIFSVPGTCVYTPALGTLLPEGSHTLSVTCTPTDLVNFEPVTTTVTIQVKPAKKKATIFWFNPSPINNPTPLGSTQLNATGSVPGVLTYSPAAGTVLEPGSYVLTVRLKPSDVDIDELEAKVTILVRTKVNNANNPNTPSTPSTPNSNDPAKPIVKDPEAPKKPMQQPDAVAIATPKNAPVLQTAGKPDEVVTVKPNAENTGYIVAAEDWSLAISSTTKFVQGNTADSSARVVIEKGNTVTTSGTGFKPFSQVDVYVYSTPIWLGAVITDEFGNFTTTLAMPAALAEGDHTFQAQGLTPDERQRTAAVPITLVPAVAPAKVVAKPGQLKFDVFFAMNSTVITNKERAKITREVKSAISKLAEKARITVSVIGWVQPNRNPGNIEFLSTNRAKNVAVLMKKLGLKGNYSLSYPGLDKNDIPEARRSSVVIKWSLSK